MLLGFVLVRLKRGRILRGNSFAVLRGAGDTGRMRLFGDGISPEEALMHPLRGPISAAGEVVRIGGPLPGPDAGLGRTTPWG